MALEQNNSEAICWAERATAPGARTRAAFKWVDGRRVPSVNAAGVQLMERLPLPAHRGSNLTGVTVATDIKSTMKVLRHDGITADIKISNGPAHEVHGDDRYELNQRNKARALGWIPIGECPAAMVAHGMIEPHTVLADDARDGKACSRAVLGIRNPPCRHYLAEETARIAAQAAKQAAREEALKSEEAKIMASNAATAKESVEKMTSLIDGQAETQARIADAIALLAANGAGKKKAAE
jgi:hypothetical protein